MSGKKANVTNVNLTKVNQVIFWPNRAVKTSRLILQFLLPDVVVISKTLTSRRPYFPLLG